MNPSKQLTVEQYAECREIIQKLDELRLKLLIHSAQPDLQSRLKSQFGDAGNAIMFARKMVDGIVRGA